MSDFAADHLVPGAVGACGTAAGAFKFLYGSPGEPGVLAGGQAAICGWFFKNGDYGLTFTAGGIGGPATVPNVPFGEEEVLSRWLPGGFVAAGQIVLTSFDSLSAMEGCTSGAGAYVGAGTWVASSQLQWSFTQPPEWTVGLGRGVVIGGTDEGEFFVGGGGCTWVITESNLPENWESLVDSRVARVIECAIAPERGCMEWLDEFFTIP